jgi:hypothetical protein
MALAPPTFQRGGPVCRSGGGGGDHEAACRCPVEAGGHGHFAGTGSATSLSAYELVAALNMASISLGRYTLLSAR